MTESTFPFTVPADLTPAEVKFFKYAYNRRLQGLDPGSFRDIQKNVQISSNSIGPARKKWDKCWNTYQTDLIVETSTKALGDSFQSTAANAVTLVVNEIIGKAADAYSKTLRAFSEENKRVIEEHARLLESAETRAVDANTRAEAARADSGRLQQKLDDANAIKDRALKDVQDLTQALASKTAEAESHLVARRSLESQLENERKENADLRAEADRLAGQSKAADEAKSRALQNVEELTKALNSRTEEIEAHLRARKALTEKLEEARREIEALTKQLEGKNANLRLTDPK